MVVRLTTRTAYAPNGIKADKQVHTQKSKEGTAMIQNLDVFLWGNKVSNREIR